MRCLFCKEPSDSSHSEEHIIPHSLGNQRHILPPGVVCDKCNNYFASKVEAPLLAHPSMRNIRAWYGVPNKKGVRPTFYGFVEGTDIDVSLGITKDGKFRLRPQKEKDAARLQNLGPSPNFVFDLEIDPPKPEMSRLLAKMAFEALANYHIRMGESFDGLIDNPTFEYVRTYARYGDNVDEWPYYQRQIYPAGTKMRHPVTHKWVRAGFGHDIFYDKQRETLFAFCLYGVEFVFNVGGPSIRGYEEWLEDNHRISPLVERAGLHLIPKGKGEHRVYRLVGKYDPRAAIEFDMALLEKYPNPLEQ